MTLHVFGQDIAALLATGVRPPEDAACGPPAFAMPASIVVCEHDFEICVRDERRREMKEIRRCRSAHTK